MLCLGTVPAGSTLYIPFATYDGATGASEACSGLAVTDIEIYKNGSTTQRASDNGYALLDGDGIDFDGITGINGFSVDLSDNSDAGFYAVGSSYWVVVSSITVDAQTVNFIAAVFRIGPAESVTGYQPVDAAAISGDTAAADNLEAACDGNTYNVGGGAIVASSVTGAVGSVTGAVGSVTAGVTLANGAHGGAAATLTLNGAAGIVATKLDAPINGAITGNITGNLSGSVGSVTGAVGSVTGAVGSVTSGVTLANGAHGGAAATLTLSGAAGIVATKLDAPINGAITGNITGNLSGSVGSVTGAVGSVTGAVGSVTAGVSLADDAITSAKFDESTAYPLKSADTGSTAVARVGADADTLETLSDQLDLCATATALDAVDNYVDTEVAAIKLVTDKLDSMIETIP
jgi:hypothetical protein